MGKTQVNIPGMDNFFIQEAYKVLRTNLQFCGQDVKVMAVTSCLENEGKSTITLGLGQSFAELGKKVLIIDADMRKSVMAARYTTAHDVKGLSEVLNGMISVNDAIYLTQIPQLHILLAGKYPPNPTELLAGKYFEKLIGEARGIFDYILIDTPPLGEVIDSAVVASKCDGTVIVCANKVRAGRVGAVIDQLRKGSCNILGIVMNNVKHNGSGYYRKKYGYKGYGGYRKYTI